MNVELFREHVRHYCSLVDETQANLAKAIGLAPSVLSHKLHGTKDAHLTYREVRNLVKTLVDWGAMNKQAEALQLLEFMECPDFPASEWSLPPLIRLEAALSSHTMRPRIIQIPIVEYEVPTQRSKTTPAIVPETREDIAAFALPQQDWGEAPDISRFYGREQELLELERWIVDERCRLVALLGGGGLGKSALSVKLTQQIARHFDFVLWRSLQNAPPPKNWLGECIMFLSHQQKVDLPESAGERISLLISYLRDARCLLVLDNVESVLDGRTRTGKYQGEYDEYNAFFRRVGEGAHQSCLLLTSREKPKDVALLEGKHLLVRTMALGGLERQACRQILNDSDLLGAEVVYQSLIDRYTGNPLALKLVASMIREVFGSDIAAFLEEGTFLFGDIRDLVDQQFQRLSAAEKTILYQLALARELVTLTDLVEERIYAVPRSQLLEALETLRRHSLLERGEAGAMFTLHPVVMEYATERVVKHAVREIASGNLKLLLSLSLMKAQAGEDVRHAQTELILKPVLERLLTHFKSEQALEQQLLHMLAALRTMPHREQGYGGGNVINLLEQRRGTLCGFDFSGLHIRQAYFVGVDLQDASFAGASFEQSVFSETFSSIFSVAFSPNNQLLAAGSVNGEVRVWQVADYRQIMILSGYKGRVWSVAFSPDSTHLASGGDDCLVRVWDMRTGQCLTTLSGHTDWVRFVAFSPDGSRLASSSFDGTVKLWEVSTGECLTTLRGSHGRVWAVAFNLDGTHLMSGSEDGMISVWEVATGKCLMSFQGNAGRIMSIAVSPDGIMLAIGSDDRTVGLWEVSTGKCLATLEGHVDRVLSVSFSPDGTQVASSGDDRMVRVWQVRTGLCFEVLHGHTGRIWAVAFSPDGTQLVSGSDDWTVRVWSVGSRQCLKTLRGHDSWIMSVAFSPDRSRFAAGSHDRTVKLWEVSTGRSLQSLRGHANWVGPVAFSPDGTLLASGGYDKTVRLWEVRSGTCLKTLCGHTNWMGFLAFSPDGILLASGNHDQTVRLWDVDTGTCIKILHGHTGLVQSVTFSPDGTLLASGCYDRTVKLWDVSTGAYLKTLHGHPDWVESVTFSPDGSTLASCSHDGTVIVWEVSSGACLRTLHSHTSRIWAVAFSLDGSTLLSGSEDKTIILWNARTGEQLEMVRNRPYERMNISGITGLTEEQQATLRELGAFSGDT